MESCIKCKEEFPVEELMKGYCENCSPSSINIEESTGTNKDYSMYLIVIPIIGVILEMVWIGSMALIDRPMNSLMLVWLFVSIGTAILATKEIKSSNNEDMNTTTWFVLFLFLWPIAYPWYMLKRESLGLKRKIVVGLLLSWTFTAVSVGTFNTIEEQKAKLRAIFTDNTIEYVVKQIHKS